MSTILVLLLMGLVSAASAQVADLVVENANIYTVDPKTPRAKALAVKDGKFIAVGASVAKHIGPNTRRIDAQGAAVIPGLIDSHVHMRSLGDMLTSFDFRRAKSPREIAEAVAKKAATLPKGAWILGRNWDQANWGDKFPVAADLDALVPDHPVFLRRVDGHAAWANTKAMQIAEITVDTKEPRGGQILKDAAGKPTGIFVDKAMGLVSRRIPPPVPQQVEESLARAAQECARLGMTTVHDAGCSRTEIEMYKRLIAAKRLPVRVYAMIGGEGELWDEYLKRGPEIGDRLTVRSIKLVADGAMGSRGALFWQPYSDDKSTSGLLMMPQEDITRIAKEALAKGFQVNTHAIGDKANSLVLESYQQAFKAAGVPGKNDKRFRVEHAQVVRLPDFQVYADNSVIASIQSTHATSDMRWASQRLGPDRMMGAWAPNRFLKAGARITNGSDFPVEDPNPLWGFYAAITRQDHEGNPPGGFMPDQILSRARALESWTMDGAFAAFEEGKKGSITVGKLADFLVLERDIMTAPPKEILGSKIKMTVLGGEIVHQ